MKIEGIHHVAVISSDYGRSRAFYTEILGLAIVRESFREERNSWKLDLDAGGGVQIELFSFPDPPARPSRPEAAGLRHLAFRVKSVEETKRDLEKAGVLVEEIRIDPYTGRKFTFFADPDSLPLELYEV